MREATIEFRTISRVLILLMFAAMVNASASAETVTYTSGLVAAGSPVSLPKFDPSLGILNSISHLTLAVNTTVDEASISLVDPEADPGLVLLQYLTQISAGPRLAPAPRFTSTGSQDMWVSSSVTTVPKFEFSNTVGGAFATGIDRVLFLPDLSSVSGTGTFDMFLSATTVVIPWPLSGLSYAPAIAYNPAFTHSYTASVAYSFEALPVPEPESYAMMLAGLSLIGMSTRRKKAAKNT